MRALAVLLVLLGPPAHAACGIALVVAVDVSGSVDAWEYELQIRGIETALRDPGVTEALVAARAAVSVVQWSGSGQQALSIPWTRIEEPAQAARLAARAGRLPRAFASNNTAVGEAIDFAAAQFGPAVRDCARWVIDLSGDGDENEGFTVGRARRAALARGITINGLAIEGLGTGQSITNFYRAWVATPGGFVITARGHADIARAMRLKLLRELAPPLADRLRERLSLAALGGAPARTTTRLRAAPRAPGRAAGFSSRPKPLW
jgi:Ca-activated chloride channel homolog